MPGLTMTLVKVHVRLKPISQGRSSVYLDFWPPVLHPLKGKPTRREFPGIYVFDNPDNARDRQHNRQIMEMARALRNKRVFELNAGRIHAESHRPVAGDYPDLDFLAYFRSLADKRQNKDRGIWISALRYLKKFSGGHLTFVQLNEEKITEFRDYLESRYLAQNTKAAYFIRFKTALKEAFREGLLHEDLNRNISGIKEQLSPRLYLTMNELNKLALAPCKDGQLRRAGLFSALTGLTFRNIQFLTWRDVYREGENYFIRILRNRTGEADIHPVSRQACELLGPAGDPGETVFKDLYRSVYTSSSLPEWLAAAGISKKMSFRGFRHTYAVNQLFLGTDIYTLSKMLGHRDLKSTLVYARIADELKLLAANRIKLEIPFI